MSTAQTNEKFMIQILLANNKKVMFIFISLKINKKQKILNS